MKKLSLIIIFLLLSVPVFAEEITTFPTEITDIKALFSTMKAQIPPQDTEFETDKAYMERISKIEFPGIYVFSSINPIAKYNLKHQTLNISFNEKSTQKQILIDSITKTNQYEGTNGFGAKKIITEYHNDDYYIYFVGRRVAKLNYDFKLSPEEAKQLKDNIGILLFCNISKSDRPFIYEDSYEGDSPTFKYPYQTFTNDHYIYVKLLEYWIFDKTTNNVLLKQKVAK